MVCSDHEKDGYNFIKSELCRTLAGRHLLGVRMPLIRDAVSVMVVFISVAFVA